MPLLVADYSWTQTEYTVYVSVPLKGAKVGKVDILSTDEYLKVHFSPYLFEAFLFDPVDDSRSTAKIGNGVAVISLQKRISKVWEDLMKTTDKEKRREVREKALLKYQEKRSSESRTKADKHNAAKKYALETMMKLEKEERDSIKKIKEAERDKTTAELATWQLQEQENAMEKSQQKIQSQRDNQDKLRKTEKKENRCSVKENDKLNERGNSDTRSKKKHMDLPAPRLAGDIQVTFTPRVFPTALRESRVQEEEEIRKGFLMAEIDLTLVDGSTKHDSTSKKVLITGAAIVPTAVPLWLKKQAEAKCAKADVKELQHLEEKERNPDWLKDKGDKCFATGDYLGAVNAYNLAIKLNRKIPALYSNRAACHLKLKNLHKAIEDSSQALDLLTPPVASNAVARTRAHVRRGSAFCQLQLYAEGLQDYFAALLIDPNNEALQADMQIIREIVQGTAAKP